MRVVRQAILAAALIGASGSAAEAVEGLSPEQLEFRDIYKQLVEINTTASVGDTGVAAEAMAERLRQAGFPAADIEVLKPAPRKGNLVARLHGTGARKPIILLAHLDVVEAKREDWEFDPFRLQEVDGYFRGRGSIDDKAMAAIFTANMIRYWKEGWKPDRDIVLMLETDEETGAQWGMRWLVENRRDLFDAELALNEGGGGALKNGVPFRNSIQLAEKVTLNFRMEVKDPGGHSSIPRRDNPIYRLAEGLERLAHYDFAPRLNEVTKAYFTQLAEIEEPEVAGAIKAFLAGKADPETLSPLSKRPVYNAQIRTTCVATMLEGGHASNALPQTARATINCRIMPDQSADEVEATLNHVIGDPRVTLARTGKFTSSPPSALDPEVLGGVERISQEMWPGVPVMPVMSTGATDSKWLRNIGIACYGVSGLFSDTEKNGVHGLNEQVTAKALYDSHQFLYRLVKTLAAKDKAG
jgi:acetylornithine deacetylase/succinyl-diaminopimelate desuccinylase-like protein